MTDDDDGLMWPPNLLKNIQDVSEQATRQQQEALQQLLLGGGGAPDLGDVSDQVGTLSAPVRPSWVVGTAELRVPYLGNIRLLFSRLSPTAVDPPATEAPAPAPSVVATPAHGTAATPQAGPAPTA